MPLENKSRLEKEKLYIIRATELQRRWKNPLDGDWNFVSNWSNEELENHLQETISQLRFEKGLGGITGAIKWAIICFVVLGVIGLLLFGIRQII